MVCHGVMALSEGVKVEAMKGSQVPAIYHNEGGGVNLNWSWRLEKGCRGGSKDGCWQGVSGFAMYGQLTPVAKSSIFHVPSVERASCCTT